MLIFSSRTPRVGLRATLRDVNPVSYWVLGGTTLGLIAVSNIPSIAALFAFTPTPWPRWLGACGIGVATFGLFELAKMAIIRSDVHH